MTRRCPSNLRVNVRARGRKYGIWGLRRDVSGRISGVNTSVNKDVNAPADETKIRGKPMAARDDMAAYMRKRRARLRAEREAAQAAPSHAHLNLERTRPARDAVKANQEVPVLTRDTPTREGGYRDGNKPNPNGRTKQKVLSQHTSLSEIWSAPPRAAAPPQSMVAIGGKPGTGQPIPGYDPTFAPHDGYAVTHAVNTASMLQALAAQVDANTREIAELKRAAADRKAQAADVAQALFGLFRHAFLSR
jgi:hypothetical protein